MASPKKSQDFFVAKQVIGDGGLVRLVTGNEKGNCAWFFIKLNLEDYSDYKRALRQDKMSLREYGNILESGWGKMPPASIVEEMKQKYEVVC